MILVAAAPEPAAAQALHDINIRRGTLHAALVDLGRQARINISLDDPALGRLQVGPVRGRYSPADALRLLLRGRPATFVQLGPRSWRISRAVQRRAPPPRRPQRPRVVRPAPPPVATPVQVEIPQEVVVTASKRGVRLRDYPASIEVLDGADFTQVEAGRGTESVLTRVPALASTHLGSGRNKLFIRGIADSSFSGPTQTTVAQYLGEARLNYNAPDPDLRLYDLRSVEVLKGPQGTLYGAGSIGGVLRLVPEAPDLDVTSGAVAGALSSTAHGDMGYDAVGLVNLPILPGELGLRALAYSGSSGGYIDDAYRGIEDINRTEVRGARAALRWAGPDGWRADVSTAVQSIRARDSQYADKSAPPLTRESPVAQPYGNDFIIGGLTVQKDWGGLSFLSSASAVRQKLDESYDATQPDEPHTRFRQDSDISLISLENRLSGPAGQSWNWVLGTNFTRNRAEVKRGFEQARSLALSNRSALETMINEVTLFGEGSFALTPQLKATAGGRITHVDLKGLSIGSPIGPGGGEVRRASRSDTQLLPSAALSYSPTASSTLFVRYQQSFRPGGLSIDRGEVLVFRGDKVAAVEAGYRFGSTGDPLQMGASLAYTRWKDIQADSVDLGGIPTTLNIGHGHIYSIDGTARLRLARGLFFDLAGVVNKSEVTNPVPTIILVPRSSLPNVARFTGRAALDLSGSLGRGVDYSASAWARYVGKSRLGIGVILGQMQGDYLDTGASFRAARGSTGVTISVTNLLDDVGNRFALGSPFTIGFRPQVTPLRPRTISIGIERAF